MTRIQQPIHHLQARPQGMRVELTAYLDRWNYALGEPYGYICFYGLNKWFKLTGTDTITIVMDSEEPRSSKNAYRVGLYTESDYRLTGLVAWDLPKADRTMLYRIQCTKAIGEWFGLKPFWLWIEEHV